MSNNENPVILLVEDEPIVAMIETDILERYGYQVLAAPTGEAAVALVENRPDIDLILMDINLGPGMDGTEAAERILNGYDIPLIFLSSHTEREVVEKTEGITSYGYIVKNTGETVLIASIKMAFRLFEAQRKEEEKERERLRSEIRLRATLENTPNVAVQWYDQQARVIYWNKASELLYGWSAEEALGQTLDKLIYSEEEEQGYRRVLDQIRTTGKPFGPYEAEVRRKDGSRGVIISSTFGIPVENGQLNYVCMDFDISERKKIEEALRESEQRIKTISNNFTSGMIYQVIVMPNGKRRFTYLSDSVKKLYGVTPEEGMADPTLIYKGVYEEDLEFLLQAEEKAERTFSMFREEIRMRDPDGGIRWSSFVSTPSLLEDGTVCFDGIEFIITERKLAEQALQEREAGLKRLYEELPTGIAFFDSKGILRQVNPKICELMGTRKEELLGKSLNEIGAMFDFDTDRLRKGFEIRLAGESPLIKEIAFINKNGNYKVVDIQSTLIMDKEKASGVLYVYNDITEKKLAEERIESLLVETERQKQDPKLAEESREEKENLEVVFNTWPDAAVISRFDNGIVVDVNEGFTELTGFLRDEVLGRSTIESNIWARPEDRRKLIVGLRDHGKCENLEAVFQTKDGRLRTGVVSAKVIKLQGVPHIISVTKDITERKMAEEKIQVLLAEKEVILKEVHHRIKNNMNVVSGLLALQAERTREYSAAAVLEDASNRIRSMMILYEKLYNSSDFFHVSIKAYLSTLVEQIMEASAVRDMIMVEKDIEDFQMDSKRLTTVGIIVNELLSNIVKYAFLGRDTGWMLLAAFAEGEKVTVIVQDNGRGMPESVGFGNSTGFGLNMVEILTKQIGGMIRIERGKGTKIVLEFEKN